MKKEEGWEKAGISKLRTLLNYLIACVEKGSGEAVAREGEHLYTWEIFFNLCGEIPVVKTVLNFGGEHSSQLCISNKFLTPSFYLSRKEATVYDEESLTFSFFFSSDKDFKSSEFVSLWHEDISKGKHFPFQAFGKHELVSYQLSLKWCNDSCWLLPDFK